MQVLIKIDAESRRVLSSHDLPFDPVNGLQKTREELIKEGGIFVDQYPDPENRIGMRGIPYYNPETQSVYYKYVSIPLSDKERINILEEAFNEILMSGMQE